MGAGAGADGCRRGWTHAGLKLQLLTQGGDACSLKRRSERNIFHKYYAEEGVDDNDVGACVLACVRACVRKRCVCHDMEGCPSNIFLGSLFSLEELSLMYIPRPKA